LSGWINIEAKIVLIKYQYAHQKKFSVIVSRIQHKFYALSGNSHNKWSMAIDIDELPIKWNWVLKALKTGKQKLKIIIDYKE